MSLGWYFFLSQLIFSAFLQWTYIFSFILHLYFSGSSSLLHSQWFSSVAFSQTRQVIKVVLSFPAEEFEKYCDDIANTAAWGGQLEVSIVLIIFICEILKWVNKPLKKGLFGKGTWRNIVINILLRTFSCSYRLFSQNRIFSDGVWQHAN